MTAADAPRGTASVLTNAAQVLNLSPEEAGQARPVRLRGVVTYSDPEWDTWFMQDATAGIYVHRTNNSPPITVGQEIALEGVTEVGGFARIVLAQKIEVLGQAPLPEAHLHSSDELAGGSHDSQWVEVEPVVRAAYVSFGHLYLELGQVHRFQAYVPDFTNAPPLELVDARVRIRGVWASSFNMQGQLTGYKMFIPSMDHISVVTPSRGDAFALPTRPVVSALRFLNSETFGHRIKVAGTVTAVETEDTLYLQDETAGLRVHTRNMETLRVGESIEAAGFPEVGGATPGLEEAIIRRTDRLAAPIPQPVDFANGLVDTWDARLIEVSGLVIERDARGKFAKLVLQQGDVFFEARLIGTNALEQLRGSVPGSRVAVTGVAAVQLNEARAPVSLALILRGPGDVRILQSAPWWTIPRLLAAFGALVFFLMFKRYQGIRNQARLKERYRLLFENAIDLICTQRPDGGFVVVNSAWTALTGHPAARLQEMRLADLVAPESRPGFEAWWTRVVQGPTQPPHQVDVLTAQGKRVWLEVSSQRTTAESGGEQIESIARDITERRHAAEALRGKDELLRQVIDLLPVFVFAKDRQSRFLFVNRTLAESTGMSAEALKGLSGLDFRKDRAEAEAFVRDDQEVLASGRPKFIPEEVYTDAAGQRRIHQTTKIPFINPATGEPALLGVAVDITGLKQAEAALRESQAQFRQLFEASPLASVLYSLKDNSILDVNLRFITMSGYAREEIIGRTGQGLGFWIEQASREAFMAAVRSGAPVLDFETRLRVRSGREFEVVLSARTIEISGGPVAIVQVNDITERKRAEKELAAQSRIMSMIAGGAALNKTLDELLLLVEEMTPGMRASILLLSDDKGHLRHGAAPSLPEAYRRAIDGVAIGERVGSCGTAAWCGEPVVVEDIATDPLWVDYKALALAHGLRACWSTPIFDDHGELLGTFAMYYAQPAKPEETHQRIIEQATDAAAIAIARHRKDQTLQQARKDSERQLALLETSLDTMSEAVIISDLEGNAYYWNRAALKMHGFASLDECRRSLPELTGIFDLFDADGQPLSLERWPLARILRGEAVENLEMKVRRKDKVLALCCTYSGALARNADGEPLLAVISIRDITERKEAEQAIHWQTDQLSRERTLLRTLIDTLPDYIYVKDLQSRHLLDNRANLDRLGVATPGDTLGKTVLDFFPEEMARKFIAEDQRVFQTGQPLVEHEFQMIGRDGQPHWDSTTKVPLRDETGRVTGLVGISRDITRRKQAEAREAELEAMLHQSQKLEAIGTLAGGIAHDFNNILSAILGRAELARLELPQGHEAQESISEILAAGLRARDLVRQILAFSRREPQNRQPIKLGAVIQEALRLLRSSLPSTIEIQQEIPAETPLVLAEETQVHQALINLGTNAGHAMRAQGGRLTVLLAALELDGVSPAHGGLPAGQYLRITVRDTGHGMDEATMNRVFEPFFTTKPQGEGTGLGLAVVHGVMRNHEGAVTIESQRDVGTTFHLYFPVAKSLPPVEKAPAEAPAGGRQEHILVVDDEPAILKILQLTLRRLGYQATGCPGPKEALAEFRADPGRFALLLSDLTMPGMTGLELAGIVHELRPALPIIIASGYATTVDAAEARQKGIGAFLHKPFDSRQLAETIRGLLDDAPMPA